MSTEVPTAGGHPIDPIDSQNSAVHVHLNRGAIAAISGSTAGLISGTVVCPFDVIKTKLQVQGSFGHAPGAQVYNGILGTMKAIVHEDGPRGLYRGLTPLLIGYFPTWGIYFYMYNRLQRYTNAHLPNHPALGAVLTAVGAGATSTVATNPIWMIKTRLMAQNKRTSWHYSGITDACRSIVRDEGFWMLYSGLSPALLGLFHVAIHFPLYEYLKQKFCSPEKSKKKNTLGFLGASVISKIVASTITYPHEVIRSRNQIKTDGNRKYHGIIPTVRVLYKEEGWRAFYAGLGANICRAVPASAATLVSYEIISRWLQDRFLRET